MVLWKYIHTYSDVSYSGLAWFQAFFLQKNPKTNVDRISQNCTTKACEALVDGG